MINMFSNIEKFRKPNVWPNFIIQLYDSWTKFRFLDQNFSFIVNYLLFFSRKIVDSKRRRVNSV